MGERWCTPQSVFRRCCGAAVAAAPAPNHLGGNQIANVGVGALLADWLQRGARACEGAVHEVWMWWLVLAVDPADGQRVRQTGRVGEEVSGGGVAVPRMGAVLRQVAPDGRVEVEASFRVQPYGGGRRGDLAHREPRELVLSGRRPTSREIGIPVRSGEEDSFRRGDRQRHAGDPVACDGLEHELVDHRCVGGSAGTHRAAPSASSAASKWPTTRRS